VLGVFAVENKGYTDADKVRDSVYWHEFFRGLSRID
jgi:hypothetical protein